MRVAYAATRGSLSSCLQLAAMTKGAQVQIEYYKTAWGDIKNSPGWFAKLCVLSLVGMIPIFGSIVIEGYLYGWAREVAWGVREPLPAKVFGNEDGKLYRRGWFIFVLGLVLGLVPMVIVNMGSGMQQSAMYGLMDNPQAGAGAMLSIGALIYFVGLVLSLAIGIICWVGSMRIAIYDRLSSGFQLGVIWKMIRHDTNGILRIFGMSLIVGFITGIILTIVLTVLIMIVLLAGVSGLSSAGYTAESLEYMTDVQAYQMLAQFVVSAGFLGVLCVLAALFVGGLATNFVEMLVARAIGYWTMQFDVPHWRGQDDPLPFEIAASSMADPYMPAQATQQPMQQAQVPTQQQAQPAVQQPAQQVQWPAQQAPQQMRQTVQPAQQVQQVQTTAQQPVQRAQSAPQDMWNSQPQAQQPVQQVQQSLQQVSAAQAQPQQQGAANAQQHIGQPQQPFDQRFQPQPQIHPQQDLFAQSQASVQDAFNQVNGTSAEVQAYDEQMRQWMNEAAPEDQPPQS